MQAGIKVSTPPDALPQLGVWFWDDRARRVAIYFVARPGNWGGPNGPVLGYVLDGKLRFAVNHEPVRIVGVGETFFEETGALHSTHGSVEGSPARALVFMVVPKGSNGAAARP